MKEDNESGNHLSSSVAEHTVGAAELPKTNKYESKYLLSHFHRVANKSRVIKPADRMEIEEIERGLSEVREGWT